MSQAKTALIPISKYKINFNATSIVIQSINLTINSAKIYKNNPCFKTISFQGTQREIIIMKSNREIKPIFK